MKNYIALACATIAILLCACAEQGRAAGPLSAAPPTPVQGARSGHRDEVSILCAEADISLIGTDRDARVETLHDDTVRTLIRPAGMDDYVPVGLGCAQSTDGAAYLVVQYGEQPRGCKVCEWFFIYDGSGKPMNESVPPMRGAGMTLEPNNDGYTRVLDELALQHPEMLYLEAPQR